MKFLITLVTLVMLLTTMTTNVHAGDVDYHFNVVSNLSAEELEEGLMYELKPYAETFITIGQEEQINAVMLASICALESGWGKYPCADNNLFGWKSDTSEYMRFDSVESCIKHVAKSLKASYLTEGGKYYLGDTFEDMNVYYSESYDWSTKNTGVCQDIERRIEKCK